MQIEMSTIFFILTAVICGIFLLISWKVGGKASESFSQYAIGGASFGMLLIFFSQFASIMGVSNFFAHAGNAYEQGVGIFAFILGEQGSKIFFALLLVGLIGKFTYNTIPEMIDDLIVRDKLTRAMCGVLASIIMISSVGSQGKAFGDLFEVFTGFSSVPIVILFSAIFIFYTVTGGVYSVVWTDLFQGILCLVVGIVFYLFTFSRVDFSLEVLRTRLAAVGKENLLSFAGMDWWGALNKFITGFIGVVSFQAYWQRCFGSKSARTAKRSMFWSGVICLGFVLMTAMTGLVIMTYNQDLNANTAMPWFMMNCMPPMMCAAIFALVLCAGMSTADSCLNSSAVLIVNDVIHPFRRGESDRQMVHMAKIVTVIVGVISCICGIYAQTVLSLLSKAYTIAGVGLVPLLLIGMFWKEEKGEQQMGKRNSRVTPWGARCGIVAGLVASQLPVFASYSAIAGCLISSVVIVVVSLLTKNVPIEARFASAGNTHHFSKQA